MDVREEVNNALSALIGENVNVDFKEDFERDGIESSLVMASVIAAKLDSIANPLSSSALDGVLLSLIVHIPTKYRRPEDGLSTKPFPLKFAKKDLLPSGVH